MANQERDPRAYELMTVFVPDISEEDTQAEVEKVSTYIANAGGTVSETLIDSPWGRRRLAYTIRYNGTDYRDGYYTVFHFDSAPSNLTELERDLKLDTSVMRYLLVHNDPKAGEKPREGEDEATEGEAPTEAPAAPQQAAAPTQQTEPEADAATASEPVEAQEQATETVAAESETAPAEAESAPEAAAVADTTEDAETPAVEADSASNEEAPAAEADSASDEEPAAEPAAVATESDTDETTDKE